MWKLRFLLNSVCASGAAVFKGLEEDNILSWFDRNEFNCGAIRLPISTEDLFIFLKDRHLNFFESMIQSNIRKEAEDIPLIAFQFWTNEKISLQ